MREARLKELIAACSMQAVAAFGLDSDFFVRLRSAPDEEIESTLHDMCTMAALLACGLLARKAVPGSAAFDAVAFVEEVSGREARKGTEL